MISGFDMIRLVFVVFSFCVQVAIIIIIIILFIIIIIIIFIIVLYTEHTFNNIYISHYLMCLFIVLKFTGLKSRTDDAFLLRFLRARKFDYDRAYNLLVNYYTIRANNTDIFDHITPSSVERIYDCGVAALLPHRDRDGRRIMYVRPGACLHLCIHSEIVNASIGLLYREACRPLVDSLYYRFCDTCPVRTCFYNQLYFITILLRLKNCLGFAS